MLQLRLNASLPLQAISNKFDKLKPETTEKSDVPVVAIAPLIV